MANDKPNLARRSLDSIKLEDMVKIFALVIGPIVIGAMAWQGLAGDVEDLEDADSSLHRRIGGIEEEQEATKDSIHEIELEQRTISGDVSRIQSDIEEIKKAVID